MSDSLAERLQALRESFDLGFAAAPAPVTAGGDHYLAIRLADDPLALRVHAIQAIAHITRIVPVPSPVPELLGLTGLRGELIPLYDLGALLSYPPLSRTPRWFVQIGRDRPLGLAFDRMEGYQVAAAADRVDMATGEKSKLHRAGLVRLQGSLRPVVDLEGLVSVLQIRLQALANVKE